MNPYKVWLLNSDNKPEKIIIFNGDNIQDFSVFTDEEFEWIDSDNTIVSRATIHNDDSICQVKHKIMKEIQCDFGDIYMFCYKKRKFNILKAMPRGDPILLGQFIKNIDLDGINVKTCINSLPLFDAECTLSIKTSLGMETPGFLFSANPFHMEFNLDTNLVANDNVLLGNEIEDNNIYICLAKDVMEYAQKAGLDTNLLSRLYFPLKESETEWPDAEADTIDSLYAAYNNRLNDLVATKGIQRFMIEFDTKCPQPLNKIFREIHCDADFPFVQYNRGIGAESVYRLYGVTITRRGKRIPILGKEKIAELSQMTEEKQLHIYNIVHNVSIIVDETGVLRAAVEQPDNDTKTVGEVETILKIVLNPLFIKYCNYQFTSFADARTVRIDYTYSTALTKSLSLQNKFVQAVYGSDMRYKRINNYGKLDKVYTLLSDLVKTRGIDATFVELITTYKFSKENATQLVQKFLQTGVFAGFPTTIQKVGNMLVIRVNGLDCIDYIEHLNIYNDSIARLMQSGGIQEQNVGPTHVMIQTSLNNIFDLMNQGFGLEVNMEEHDGDEDEQRIGFSDDENEDIKDNKDNKDSFHHMSLENNFYNLYRSLILVLIQKSENQKRILNILDKPNKKELLAKLVKRIADPVILFSKISKKVLDTISSDDIFRKGHQIMIPKRNLITGEENRTLYSKTVAKEIIKNKLLQKLISIEDVLPELTLNTNEYIVLESLLFSSDYFTDMVASKDNECLTMVPVDESRDLPILAGSTRLEFKATAECSFGPLVYMLYELKNIVYPLSSVKSMLWKAYQLEFNKGDKSNIIITLKGEGKKELINIKIYDDELEELIKSEGYFMTALDVSVFAKAYKIPVVLFRKSTGDKSVVIGAKSDKYFFYESMPTSHGIPQNVLINQMLAFE